MSPLATLRPLAALALLSLSLACAAQGADRNQPVNLEADKVMVDERNRTHIFEGNVTLTQGTLSIRAAKIVVTQDAEGFQKGVATGGPGGLSRFRRKRDGHDDYVDGEGERIEHDARNDITQFFNRAWLKSGQDEIRGQYVSYNSRTENYTVTSGDKATSATNNTAGSRVRAVIMPRTPESPAPAAKPKE